ncbi:MAG: hypothetical protein AAF639_12780 [Chloroflexota bacterium]
MTRTTRIIFAIMMAAVMMVPALAVSASSPTPIIGPRMSPQPIPHTMVINPYRIYNDVVVVAPSQSIEADLADGGASQEAPGRYVKQLNVGGNAPDTDTHAVRIDNRDAARGLTLYPQSDVCNNFNTSSGWSTIGKKPPVDDGASNNDIWSDWYGGWGPFALDDGYYRSKNTTFSLERSVGPGINFNKGYSAKIGSTEPYAGGFGSPMLAVTPGAEVTVKVNYLIGDHNQHGYDYDWASMGLKPDAEGPDARYVNGYTRGQWAQMVNTVTAGPSGYIMVLIQGQSPAQINSNIYFDDVRIYVDGKPMSSCTWAE